MNASLTAGGKGGGNGGISGSGGLISRRTTSNGGANSLPGESPSNETFVTQTLKTVDVFKRNDALEEFSKEGSNKGGVLTLLFAWFIFGLVTSQVQKLFATSMRTDLSVDHDMDPTLVMQFDVSFPAINCEHLSVDLVDAVGHRAFNLSGESIYKHSMSKEIPYLAIEHATMGVGSRQHFHAIAPRSLHPNWEGDEGKPLGRIVQGDEFDYIVGDDDNEYGGEVNDEEEANDKSSLEQRRDEYGYRRFALLLNSENFKRNVNAHGVLLVNFHAPWCSHCAALAPHFERGAQLGISHNVILFTHLFNNTISQFKKLSQSR
jgi:thiol-disulfide isomerase/thioredoxin